MIYLILGASAGLGRSLSKKLASEGHHLILVATENRDLEATASDIMIRYHVRVETLAANVCDNNNFLDEIERIIILLGGLDGIFCPIGAVSSADNVRYDLTAFRYITDVNYTSVVSVITRFWELLIHRSHPTIVVGFGSIASIRGRNFNVVYSAAKRSLLSFFESLRYAGISKNVIVQFYILGYLDTNLAFGKRTLLPKASTEILAHRIFDNLQNDFGITYYPRYWYAINLLLKITPWVVFKRLTF